MNFLTVGVKRGWLREYFFPWSHMVPLCFLIFSLLPAVRQGLFTVSNQEQDVKIIWVLSAKGTVANLHVRSLDTLAENKLAGFFLILFLLQNFNPICKRTYLQRKKPLTLYILSLICIFSLLFFCKVPEFLKRRICSTVKSFLSWWSLPIFLWP